MRILLFILVVLAAGVCVEKPAKAQNGAWCAYYNTGDGGSRNCGFASFEQCLATVRGIGGNCGPVRILPRQGHRVDVQGPNRLRLA